MGQLQPEIIDASISCDEFNEIFEPGPAQVVTYPIPAVTSPTLEAVTNPPQAGVPLEEASRLLNLHVDTIKKRLRKGTIKGFKVQEKYGEKWFVSSEDLPDPAQAVTDHAPEAVRDPTKSTPDPTLKPVVSTLEVSTALDRIVASLEKKDAIIESQAHQLKAAGDVILYLRAQLDEKEVQLKLLTDSQHKRGWYARLCSWFAGR